MADRLGDLLPARRINEPPEIEIIKKFVADKFDSQVSVIMSEKIITIVVDNSSLAGALRMELHNLLPLIGSDKRLLVRIQ